MKWTTTLFCLIFGAFSQLSAQDSSPSNTADPKDDAFELGIHAGHFFASGNIEFTPGFGTGIHIRKSLDYIFSLRGELLYGKLMGEDNGNIRSYETSWLSGSLDGVVSLNNLKWFPRQKKTDLYVLFGIGGATFSGDLIDDGEMKDIDTNFEFLMDMGAGISFKISPKINVGIEHKIYLIFNNGADKVDGVQTIFPTDNQTLFRDVPNYTSVRINFNLGKEANRTEPRYWLMPIDRIVNDIDQLKDSRITLTDEDNDGVIDQLDEQENTPEGAKVNAKGVAIDSDGDGKADYEDDEPFSPKGATVDGNGVAEKRDVMAEVNALLEEKLKNFEPKQVEVPSSTTNWYLPSIFFNTGSSAVRDSEIGLIYNVSEVIKSNSDKKFVVTGFADVRGNDVNNQMLSYNRAKSVIEALEAKGVERNQLILQYKGENNPISKNNVLNRRVDFKIATIDDGEMSAPINDK